MLSAYLQWRGHIYNNALLTQVSRHRCCYPWGRACRWHTATFWPLFSSSNGQNILKAYNPKHTHTHTYARIHTHARARAHTHTHTDTHTYARTHARMQRERERLSESRLFNSTVLKRWEVNRDTCVSMFVPAVLRKYGPNAVYNFYR